MSKMDNLRAMREARYAEMTKRAASTTPAKPAAAKKKPPVAPAEPAAAVAEPSGAALSSAEPALCGHRNMSGRTCTREQGHSAKSHRYS